ncbi:Phospholipid scramblase 1 [Blattella germanica]|nr:Phospholipid scramblase 1 [Blattella germanica]
MDMWRILTISLEENANCKMLRNIYPKLVIVCVKLLVVTSLRTITFLRHLSREFGKIQAILLGAYLMKSSFLHHQILIMPSSSQKKRKAFTGFETQNKYTVKNSVGQKVYYAVEDSDCLTRNCCGPIRPFDMKILDNYKNEVIHLNRPLACDSCWFPCCLQVLSRDGGTQVGKISKQWSGLLREAFTDADYFGITFPMDLDVKMKAVMLGACFLIKRGNKESDRPGMF